VRWPHDHVGLAGGSTSAASRRRRRRFKGSRDASLGVSGPTLPAEANGGGGFSNGSPELAPVSTTTAVNSGRIAICSYRHRNDAIKVSKEAQAHPEVDGLLVEVDGGRWRAQFGSFCETPVKGDGDFPASEAAPSRFLPPGCSERYYGAPKGLDGVGASSIDEELRKFSTVTSGVWRK
jgi:hypothetical protein